MKLKCIIVDDEPMARKVLEEHIEDIDFLELVAKAENPVKANAILNHETVDLMFLDINMPKISGIEFLRSSSHLPMTVLTTAYEEYALDGFELDVVDYLVKPIPFERFLKACNKAKEVFELKQSAGSHSNAGDNFFFVKCDGKIEKVFYDDLICVEAMLNYVVLHTKNRKMMVYLTIKSVLDQLPSSVFLKVHKSFVINTAKIISIEGNEINLGTMKVTISQNAHDQVMKEIIKDKLMKR